MKRNLWWTSVGTIIEWAEFSFFGYIMIPLANQFLPHLRNDHGILLMLATFAVSFFARPLGAIFFGHFGDRHGRKTSLSMTMGLMAISCLGTGILPTYHQIGLLAPILLIILRFLQGFAISGEFTGAGIFMVEQSRHVPLFFSSLISTSAAFGMLLGALCAFLATDIHLPIWSWRIPYLVGFFWCFSVFYFRRYIFEAPLAAPIYPQQPIVAIFKYHKTAFLRAFCLAAFVGIFVYTCNTWWTTHVIQFHWFTREEAQLVILITQTAVVILTPIMGFFSEYAGPRITLSLGLIGSILTAPLLILMGETQNIFLVTMTQLLYAFSDASVTSVMFYYFSQLFPAPVRYTGIAATWNIAAAIFAGTAPLTAQSLLTIFHSGYGPALYVSLAGLVALIATCFKAKQFQSTQSYWTPTIPIYD